MTTRTWIKYVGGREMVFVICPHCKKQLNAGDNDRQIPLKITVGKKKGKLILSAIWGDYEHITEGIKVSPGEVVEMFCPHCNATLKGSGLCKECNATTTVFGFSDGYIGICNRKGCKMHVKAEKGTVTVEKLLRLRVDGWDGPYSPF